MDTGRSEAYPAEEEKEKKGREFMRHHRLKYFELVTYSAKKDYNQENNSIVSAFFMNLFG
jgi:hypothetical protein